jgi:hypothetical protein
MARFSHLPTGPDRGTLGYVAGKRGISFLLPSGLGWHIGASRDAY